jgi:extracellular elastinolytic metalloproteinase
MGSRRFSIRAAALVVALAPAAAALAASPADVAREYVKTNKQSLGLTGSDINEMTLASQVPSAHNGVTHVYFQQAHRGIPVHTGVINVNVAANGSVISAGSRFVPNLAAAAAGQNPKKAAVEAAVAAVGHVNLKPTSPIRATEHRGGARDTTILTDGGIAAQPIEASLLWLPVTSGKARLAWGVEIEETSGDHSWLAFVDAETGESLGQEDRVVHDEARAIADAISHDTPAPAALVPSFAPTDGARYNVYPMPYGSPLDTERVLVQNAANPLASPFGWHDTNGVAGAEFTITRGNNVHAYADRDNNNQIDPGSDPNGGAALNFDFAIDLGKRPQDNQAAMVTNLFYWNNIMHDVTYVYGFNEVARNFQQNNYGKGGLGNDWVRAEAQDGSGRNNANFASGREGGSQTARMQMFEWRSSAPNPVTVLAPSPIAGTYDGPMAGFGESLTTTGAISGQVLYIGRGCDPAFQAGQPLDPYPPAGTLVGKIALIDRGSCEFQAKVRKAEVNGAKMVIVANNIAGPATAMGGANPLIKIPSVMVSQDDGNLFRPNAPFDVTIADGTGGVPDRDSDLDAGVIAHEYGHGVSNRLTGTGFSCLNNDEQMGEGWSDFFGMTLTARPTDTALTARGVGTYVSFQPADGAGIRPTAYSTDMTVNPATYASVADTVNISLPHGIGYVWNSMLWEMYWNLVDRYGFNSDLYGKWNTGGNNLAIQLVMDGLKFQPCRPGFVDGRNAILQADVALTGGANQCEIWRGFAKRGLGVNASQGLSTDRTDGVADFNLPASCKAATFGGFREPVANAPEINSANAGSVVPVKFGLDGAYIAIDTQDVDCANLASTGKAPSALESVGSPAQSGSEYHINWKTDASWAGTCRKVTIRIPAAENAVAYFRFN